MNTFYEKPPVSEKINAFLFSHGYDDSSSWQLAGSAGSGRKYYRISGASRTAILQVSASVNEDFDRFVRFGKVFHAHHLPVPRIYAVDETAAQILMQDIGIETLFEKMKKDEASIEYYPEVIQSLVNFQNASSSVFSALPELGERRFGYDILKWETSYFSKNYLKKHCGITEIPQAVEEFFSVLACAVDAHSKVLMHRDFQSQNILLGKNGKVGFVDFQGAYHGSLFYDLASLLWDPYIQFPVATVRRMFDFWKNEQALCNDFSTRECWVSFLEASLQRVMQAIGAYCFLSKEKQIESFEQFIEPGVAQLKALLTLYREESVELNPEIYSFLMGT